MKTRSDMFGRKAVNANDVIKFVHNTDKGCCWNGLDYDTLKVRRKQFDLVDLPCDKWVIQRMVNGELIKEKLGFCYVIGTNQAGVYKIGKTKNLLQRLTTLRSEYGSLTVEHLIFTNNTMYVEGLCNSCLKTGDTIVLNCFS